MDNAWDDYIKPLIGLAVCIIIVIFVILGANLILKDIASNYVTFEEFYTSKGLLAKHQMSVFNSSSQQAEGSVSGGGAYLLFVGGGSINGSYKSSDVFQFNWFGPDGFETTSTVAYGDIKWDIQNDTTDAPSFEFVFSQSTLGSSIYKYSEIINYNDIFPEAEAVIIHISQDIYNRDVLCPINPSKCQ